jgi:glycosyltransferase involved in cell wall biosynthesis
MTLKVLTIYYKHRRGGFCKRFRLKIEAYLKAGWQVHYIAVEPYPYQDENLISHILPCPFQKHSGLFFWGWFFTMTPLYALALGVRHKFHLISAATPVYAWISGPAKWLRKTPMVTLLWTKPQFTTDCHENYQSLNKLENILERWGVRWSDRMIANSDACRSSWIQRYHLDTAKVDVHPNHVDTLPFKKEEQRQNLIQELKLADDAFIIASTSIFEPHKNLEFLIAAFSHVDSERAVLVLIGAGEQRSHLKKVAQALGIAERVIFTGWRDDARKLLQGSDLFVFPSLREGMSESLLEATTCKIPCLVSAIPENMEVVRNPEQHFNPHQTHELFQKINRCIEDGSYYDDLLKQTEADGRRYVFDWGKGWIERIQQMISPKV